MYLLFNKNVNLKSFLSFYFFKITIRYVQDKTYF